MSTENNIHFQTPLSHKFLRSPSLNRKKPIPALNRIQTNSIEKTMKIHHISANEKTQSQAPEVECCYLLDDRLFRHRIDIVKQDANTIGK